MINNYPVIRSISDLGTVGFYEFKRASVCPFGGISESKHLESGYLPEPTPNKQLIIGNLYHELMDEAKKASSKQKLVELANELFVKYQGKYSQFIKKMKLGSIKSWSEIGKALSAALILAGNNHEVASNKLGLLVSKNNRFKGVPDKYTVINTEANIVEYKSASIFVDGKVKDEYLEQVKFYSLLIRENFPDVMVFKARLISLSGESYELEFDIDKIDKYGTEIDRVYNEISNNLSGKNFNFESCINCAKKSICSVFLTESKEYNSHRAVFVLNGSLSLINHESSSCEAHVDGMVIKFTNTEFVDSLRIDKEYTFYNLFKSKGKYFFTENSGIYEHC